MNKRVEVKSEFEMTKGLGLYLPKGYKQQWEKEHRTEETTMVNFKIPLNILRSLFETVAAISADDLAVILGRWAGMTPHIATLMSQDLTAFVKIVMAHNLKPRWKPNTELHSWRLSREMGWDQVKK